MDNEWEKQRQKDLEYIRNFRLIDDDFMKVVFEDEACAQLLLRIVLEIPDIVVEQVKTEYVVHNISGRSVRFDVFAVDSTGKRYNVEIQRNDKGASRKRARFNSALLDVDALKSGKDHDMLPESYVIFITENDIIGKAKPVYHVERMIIEADEFFEDKSHIIYVNSQIKNDTPLGKLMSDFYRTKANEMNYKELSDRVKYFKETEGGTSNMCKAMEEMRAEVAEKALAQGMVLGKIEGIAEGKIEGKIEGRAEGKIEGIAEGKKNFMEQLLKSGILTKEQTAALQDMQII